MKLNKSWLLPATYTIILVVTTYATTIQAAKQKQAEVNLPQVTASPSRSLKYGDKTTKKLTNEEILFLSTSPTIDQKKYNSNSNSFATERQQVPRNRLRSRTQHVEVVRNQTNKEISSRFGRVSQQEITTLEKTDDFSNKPLALEGDRQRSTITNRLRSKNTLTENQQISHSLQPTLYPNSNKKFEEIIINKNATATSTAAVPIANTKRQRILTATLRSATSTNSNDQRPFLSNNANVGSHQSANSNSTVVRHYHSNRRNNNNSIISTTQPLLTLATTSGRSNKHTGNNISDKQSVSSNDTNSSRTRSIVRKFTSNASTITIISSTPTSTTTTTPRPSFQLPNAFNIFAPEFWQFLNPITSTTPATITTKRPPKKYKPLTPISNKEEKLSLVKPKPTNLSRIATKPPEVDNNFKNNSNIFPKKDEGPFRIALPTRNILSSKRVSHSEREKGKRNVEKEINLRERFDCPRESEVRFQLFPKICKIDEDCKVWNREEICCDIFGAKSCVSGIPKPLEETSHAPILGVIPRKCPSRPLAELWWEVKECETDIDCWPRVCCPDGRKRYCRTSQPELNTVPVPVQRSFSYLSEYLECTPPPPPIFDLHPKDCTSTFDCFPNVCCQEAGLRHCRPPKKSVLTMLANVFNVDFVKRLTQNIVIK